MGLKDEWIRFGEEPHLGYFCYPERAVRPIPALIVLQEAWGVDLHIQDVTRRLALAGYAALAPDLYAKAGERPAPLANERLAELKAMLDELPSAWRDEAARSAWLAKKTAPERERILETFGVLRGNMGNVAGLLPILTARRDLAAPRVSDDARAEGRRRRLLPRRAPSPACSPATIPTSRRPSSSTATHRRPTSSRTSIARCSGSTARSTPTSRLKSPPSPTP